MTIIVGSLTKIDSHDDLAQDLLPCACLMGKYIAKVFSLSVRILCSFLVKKLNSMIIDHHADSMLVEQENCNFPGLF